MIARWNWRMFGIALAGCMLCGSLSQAQQRPTIPVPLKPQTQTATPTQTQTFSNPFGLCSGEKSGSLVICGGGRLDESVYQEFLRLAGGKEAHLVHIPTAYPFSSASAVRSRYSGWTEYNVASFAFLDAADREEAEEAAFLKTLDKATGVWFGGGAQERLANVYGKTKAEAALQRVLARGGVIGGTSAGASIMSNCMIAYGSSNEAVCDRGLGFANNCVIDQHFAQRNRLPRLLGVLEEHPQLVGIGIDEGTAVILREDRVKIMGAARATFCVPAPNRGVTLHRLQSGNEAQLVVRKTSPAANTLAWELRPVAKR